MVPPANSCYFGKSVKLEQRLRRKFSNENSVTLTKQVLLTQNSVTLTKQVLLTQNSVTLTKQVLLTQNS
ncbi:hypothetical protein DVH26_30475 [Paenibacillus sp. H1-7]|nr:hypothetical protein DVH26_30475 [Paenibacillus sp. H1-7]